MYSIIRIDTRWGQLEVRWPKPDTVFDIGDADPVVLKLNGEWKPPSAYLDGKPITNVRAQAIVYAQDHGGDPLLDLETLRYSAMNENTDKGDLVLQAYALGWIDRGAAHQRPQLDPGHPAWNV